jgi:glycosyltransferase A (GT-A) superfamily protein (DUF2064 family)
MNEDEEMTVDCGYAAFDAAELLQIACDRSWREWAREELDDVMRARDIVRAALVSVLALVGGDVHEMTRRMERALVTIPEGRALRDALRRGEKVAFGDLSTLYARVMREVQK